MIEDGVANVVACSGWVGLVSHVVKSFELGSRALADALDAVQRILRSRMADKRNILAALGAQPQSAFAKLPPPGQVVGADKSIAGIAETRTVHIGIDGNDMYALFPQVAHFFGNSHIVGNHRRDADADDVGLRGVLS